MEGAWQKSGRRITAEDLGIIPKSALLMDRGNILWAGPEKQLRATLFKLKDQRRGPKSKIKISKEFDVGGRTVLPGWLDAHTHTVFAGARHHEFEMRCQGASYQEIALNGGGILSTMRATRQIKKAELKSLSQDRVDAFLRQGVTTLEIKSGYALDLKGELKQLEVARSLVGPRIITTFLGAHAKPPEFSSNSDYLDYLKVHVLPVIKKKKLADRVDIFIEKNFFEGEAAKAYLETAKAMGFAVVVHADQLSLSGGTQTAVTLEALSADHVIQLGRTEIDLLAGSETTAVLLPMADLYMKCAYPPARELIDRGARVALATDFNPGSCPSQDIQLVGLLARLQMGMSLPEIIAAWTVGAAKALGLTDTSALLPGFKADLQVINGDWQGLFYQAGATPTEQVFVRGKSLL
jgi:imidazolonepropionase